MWNWDYEEEGTNIRDGVRGTVTGGCSKGMDVKDQVFLRQLQVYQMVMMIKKRKLFQEDIL